MRLRPWINPVHKPQSRLPRDNPGRNTDNRQKQVLEDLLDDLLILDESQNFHSALTPGTR